MLDNPYGKSYKYSENLYSSSILDNKYNSHSKPYSLITYDQYSTKSSLWNSPSTKVLSPYHSWTRQPTKTGCQHCSKKTIHQNPFLRSSLLHKDYIGDATYSNFIQDQAYRENRNSALSYRRNSYLSESSVPTYSGQPYKNNYSSVQDENKKFEAIKEIDQFIPRMIDSSFKKEAFRGYQERYEERNERQQMREEKVGRNLRIGMDRESEDSFDGKKFKIDKQIYQSFSGQDSPRFLQKQKQSSIPPCIEYNHRKFHLVDLLTLD